MAVKHETGNSAVVRVMADIAQRADRSQNDHKAPIYHFRPVTGWMNDVNGLLQYKGYYHVFFQLHPYSHDHDGRMYWGHTRSKDLVHWERLPVAIWPSLEKNEKSCWSGCATINGQGQPMIFYTAVFNERGEGYDIPFQQWSAVAAGEELIEWIKHPANPMLDFGTHAQEGFDKNWRDPFLFDYCGRKFLTLATGKAGYPLPLYEAQNDELTQWRYLGTVFDRNAECPNLFPLDNQWVFLTSAYKNGTEYYTGAFDLEGLAFTPRVSGFMDTGYQSAGFKSLYGTNVLFDQNDRCLLFGRFNGFDGFCGENGWNGCMALPRVLSLDSRGRLMQRPVPELEALRKPRLHRENVVVDNGVQMIADNLSNALEIELRIERGSAHRCGLELYCCGDRDASLTISFGNGTLRVMDTEYALQFCVGDMRIDVRLFLDRSVIEIFLNDGLETLSYVFDPGTDCGKLELFSEGGTTEFPAIDIWEMGNIWSTRG